MSWKNTSISPVQKYQFLFSIGAQEYTTTATSVTFPSYNTEGFTSTILNHQVKYPGIGTWDDLVVTFVLTEFVHEFNEI